MVFRGSLFALVAMSALSFSAKADSSITVADSVAVGRVETGAQCEMDIECAGSLDCQDVGSRFRPDKRCLPITCAKGAGMALLENGFDKDGYVHDVLEKAELNGRTTWRKFNEEEGARLQAAIQSTEPPMDVFNQNFTACMNPVADGRRLEDVEGSIESTTAYGLQWSAVALFSYIGKWTTWDSVVSGQDVRWKMLQNCVGSIVGFDVGVDALFQIFTNDNIVETLPPSSSYSKELEYIHILTAGPLGIQVGWFSGAGPTGTCITEVTIGGSFGAALGGYTRCFTDIDIS